MRSPAHPLLVALLALLALPSAAKAQEFRAMWADTFHAGLRNSSETTALIAAARAAKCNAVLVEVRRRADSYYRDGLEPVATDVAAGFDPLADLIQKGHTGTPRIEVHAWIVTYNAWNSENTAPIQPTHPFNLHPDWLTSNNTGATWVGTPGASGNYVFDPGHPAVQRHTFAVCMDLVTRYDIDGLHFDYVRYPDHTSGIRNQPWGYNPVAIARFKAQTGATTTPGPTDAAWLQWRRDQVTALVRKVYLHAWALKPNVNVSAALIVYGNAPANLDLATWQNTEAYARVLQDWRAWMEEGILDLACPMIYRDQDRNSGFTAWSHFMKDRQYQRAGAAGMGWYLNEIDETILQVKNARLPSPARPASAGSAATTGGKLLAGVLGYSYAVNNGVRNAQDTGYINNPVSPATMRAALTDDATAELYDPGGTPVFATNVSVPAMAWKTNAAKGHFLGTLVDSRGVAFDGINVALTGPVARTLKTDGTGFFGAVDLPAGSYTLSVSIAGYRTLTRTFSVGGAVVAQPPMTLEMVPLQITAATRSIGGTLLNITWNSLPQRTYRIEGSPDLQQWSPIAAGVAANGLSTTFQWSIPAAWRAKAFARVIEEP